MVSIKLSAQDLFRAAYENRYTWDQNFPGYWADVTYKKRDASFTGRVCLSAKFKPEVFDVEDEAAHQAILEQLREIAIHRVRRSFEETHGRNSFSLGETDATGAVEIQVGGKSAGDHYKVRNNEVCKVHRHIHGVVVTINTLSSHNTGQGYLSHRYTSVYHDPKTGQPLSGLMEFEDEYAEVGGYFVLSRRKIEIEPDVKSEEKHPEVQEFIFCNFQAL